MNVNKWKIKNELTINMDIPMTFSYFMCMVYWYFVWMCVYTSCSWLSSAPARRGHQIACNGRWLWAALVDGGNQKQVFCKGISFFYALGIFPSPKYSYLLCTDHILNSHLFSINLEGETSDFVMNPPEYIKIVLLVQNSHRDMLLGPLCYFQACFRDDTINFTGLFTKELRYFLIMHDTRDTVPVLVTTGNKIYKCPCL